MVSHLSQQLEIINGLKLDMNNALAARDFERALKRAETLDQLGVPFEATPQGKEES